jgi:hypothetical protein
MDLSGLLDRTMIPDFPIPDSGIPNSEFRMAYGEPRIPHHEIGDHGGGGGSKGILYHWSEGGGGTSDDLCQ